MAKHRRGPGLSATDIADKLRSRTEEMFGMEVVRYFVDARVRRHVLPHP
ncbi:MAG: hypothetical protein IIA59_01475 [Candidatus Marinimicrobia bacterium]|nr:hypothetical protein [Candidatus Neomarinimicrobiota bacterium]